MKRLINIFCILIVIGIPSYSQLINFHGVVQSKSSQEGIPFVTITLINDSSGKEQITYTDYYGSFFFNSISKGIYNIRTNYAGFQDTIIKYFAIEVDTISIKIQISECSPVFPILECPVCHKIDQVIRVGRDALIINQEPWSDPSSITDVTRRTKKLGYETYIYKNQELLYFLIDKNNKIQYYNAFLCDKLLFCKRDKIVYKSYAP